VDLSIRNIETYYKCNGTGDCRYSGTCKFNTGDPNDCHLTSSFCMASCEDSVRIKYNLITALAEAQEVFNLKYDPKTHALTLIEKENKDGQ